MCSIATVRQYMLKGDERNSLGSIKDFTEDDNINERSDDNRCPSLLHLAVDMSMPSVVKELLTRKADVWLVNEQGHTAVHLWASKPISSTKENIPNDLIIGKCLIETEKKVCNVGDKYGKKPLQLAIERNDYHKIRCVLSSLAILSFYLFFFF